MHDLSVPHVETTHHRREPTSQRSREMRPLLTREPLPDGRERRPAAQPSRRRKRAPPTTPVFTFDPLHNHVPSGRQDPPPSQLIAAGPASETLPISHDEQPMTPVVDHDHSYDGRDVQTRPRIFSEYPLVEHSTSPYPDSPGADTNDMSSVPPPVPSDQPLYAAEYTVYMRPPQTPVQMYPYVNQAYTQPPVFHQDSYGYSVEPSPDRGVQNYSAQHFDAAPGRAGPHSVGVPAFTDSSAYPYQHRRY